MTESAAPEKILSAAVTDPATGLHSLLSTKSYTDVIELLASDQLAKVVALARERYDYVIIDSPPPVSYTHLMEQTLGMPLNGTVSAQQLGETNLIRVTVTADTPRQALVLLKAVSDNYGSLSAHVSSTAVLSQLNSPSLSVAPSRSYNVPRICLMAAIAGAALTALGVAWASVSSGTVQTQEGARSRCV